VFCYEDKKWKRCCRRYSRKAKKRVTLRKREVDTREDEGDIIDAVAMEEESTLMREEKVWLHGRLVVGLEKTRSVLAVIKDDSLADDKVFEESSDKQSLGEVLAALNGNNRKKNHGEESIAQMFRSLFNDEEWTELEASNQAISAGDEGKLRMLRLQRQRKLLWETRNVAIDLTVRDDDVAGEQTKLVTECMNVMNVVLDRIGMNARGIMRRVVPVPAVPVAFVVVPVKQRKQKKKGAAVKLKGRRKSKSKQSKKVKEREKLKLKKREERSQEEDGEEEEEGEEGELEDDRKRAKTSSDDVEEEDADEDIRVDIDALLERAKLDVDVGLNMLKERDKGGGLVLKSRQGEHSGSKLCWCRCWIFRFV
jgi:hypothetical protein